MKAVIFDLDGTLADTRHLYMAAYAAAFEEVLGRALSWDEVRSRNPSAERRFLLDWLGDETGDRVHRRMVEVYSARAAELHGPLFDGVPELVAGLREAGLATAIVTGKSRAAFEVSAHHVALEGYGAVIVEDDVPHPKPDPTGIQQALEVLGIAADQSVYVGDTPMDLDAARRAGSRPAAALWGRRPEDRARAAEKVGDDAWALLNPSALLERLSL